MTTAKSPPGQHNIHWISTLCTNSTSRWEHGTSGSGSSLHWSPVGQSELHSVSSFSATCITGWLQWHSVKTWSRGDPMLTSIFMFLFQTFLYFVVMLLAEEGKQAVGIIFCCHIYTSIIPHDLPTKIKRELANDARMTHTLGLGM